jgi:hypothetical protein
MQVIKNLTPHAVRILDHENNILRTFVREGLVRLKVDVTHSIPIDGVRTTVTVFGEPEGLPERMDGFFYIVSQLVKNACPDRDDLLVPAEVVRDGYGKILGCRSLGR